MSDIFLDNIFFVRRSFFSLHIASITSRDDNQVQNLEKLQEILQEGTFPRYVSCHAHVISSWVDFNGGETAAKPETAVQDRVSTFVRVKQLDCKMSALSICVI